MPLAVVPARAATTPGAGFYALVQSVRTGLLSKKVSCLFIEVLSGSVKRGDPVELIHPDGSTTLVVARELRDAFGQMVLDLADPHPAKTAVGAVTVARTPGLLAPPLPEEGRAAVDQLLGAVQATRSLGFPVEQVRLIKPLLGQPEQVCSYLRGLPDEAVVLLVQKRVRDAMAHHANPFDIMYDAQRAAMHLAAIGLSDDGDRLLLVAAAAVQGHKSSVALRAAASAGAMGVLATENAVGSALDIGKRVGWAMGIEMGDAFAKGFESGVKVAGEEVETLLLEAGRAVGVGRCKKCHEVVEYKLGQSGITASRELRCPTDNRKADDPVIVVPADAPNVRQSLRNMAQG